ncbi:DNA-deoxyinosine glycosylase [Ammoniphilus resinae]|uniref:Hypoxanthine-DNA glycosylase n=1 Tax=Ammoniphilus resinae TaxID=861532 RepID=A0ABS4GP38_9BACL|nr:DNA-deoxyinosine glycosylase [Ammoniphilus resinae]MBP1932042.1 hypoxanthine-DNA glycosylase [Ammoniphilus resinae]
MYEVQSFEPIIANESEVLILGTMPGEQSLQKGEYYANTRNQFWKIIYSIFDIKPDVEYKEKILFLKSKRIALWDVVDMCERQGSLDSNIKNEKPNNITSIISQYPNLRCVIFNGSKAHELFKKHIGLKVLEPLVYKTLPSTSPVPGKYVKSLDEKIDQWKVIKDYLS